MILVCNDDGVHAPGLAALAAALAPLDRVFVVAPDREQSAAGHAITLSRPLRAELLREGWMAVDGTPTDCVNLAVNGLLDERPWLVVSGINRGANLGDDITYSGTVSAAMEAVLLGIPAIAVSQAGKSNFDYGAAACFTANLCRVVKHSGLPDDTLLNVNVPENRKREGFVVTRQGRRRYGDAIVEKTDPRGRKYYWIGGDDLGFDDEPGTDLAAVHAGLVSVTPLHLDLTNHGSLGFLDDIQKTWAPD
ncbi:MAG TPA: 5'/3'-nucleotidase SurE [Deltaproteobacteria bacterium]|nr:5'/3'-nucleotidase SurE [Candidatus Binatota bacterium]HIL13369.1 5'/3'-nucleotidase SurE [Deltaproteobacteria bacterium]